MNDGGPAFPQHVKASDDRLTTGLEGMSVLQYYAGLAMQALLIADDGAAFNAVALMAFEQAQAMIEDKEKLLAGDTAKAKP